MKSFRHNPHPVDMKDILMGNLSADSRGNAELEDWDEEYTDSPVPVQNFRTKVLKLGKSVSEKLFSIELGRISF
ncbi:MAG: hypothetical protein V4598_04215 [Bdellovibrionota bacterium]